MSWIWKTKTMGWIEQKLINITTTIYMKRREPEPMIMPLGYEPPAVTKVKRPIKAKPLPNAKRTPKAVRSRTNNKRKKA